MDKQKQIEEMAKEIEIAFKLHEKDFEKVAVILVGIGYRKITDEVVLTREECQELTVCRLNNEKASEVLLHFENVEKRIRKEMAEKFAERLKEKSYDVRMIQYFNNDCPSIEVVDVEDIDEICKEITEDKE